jgi:hypothetical protein
MPAQTSTPARKVQNTSSPRKAEKTSWTNPFSAVDLDEDYLDQLDERDRPLDARDAADLGINLY